MSIRPLNVIPFRSTPPRTASIDQCQSCGWYADAMKQMEADQQTIARLRRENILLSKQLSAIEDALLREATIRAKFDEESS